MAIGAGNNITATDFNALVVAVNKYWGDNVPSAAVTDPDRSTHKYGWGQTHALELSGTDDRVAATETVEAKHFNQLEQLFEQMDTDGDGIVSYEEFENAVSNVK